MKKNKDTKERIMEAALIEFAGNGFGGARMDAIAKSAEINKAMLFYYFTSKENLYQTVITDVLKQYLSHVQKLLSPTLSPEKLLEQFPNIIVTFFSQRTNFIKLIGIELLNNPQNVTSVISPFINGNIIDPAKIISKLVDVWYKKGLISENDPVHFMMNIMSLCLGSFIARPMVEAVFDIKFEDDQAYFEKRIQSIVNVLKNGMLK